MTTDVLLGDGNSMPLIGFGTYLIDNEHVYDAVCTALRIGYRHIDTAEYYCNEEGIGRALAACGIPRSNLFITTKINPGGRFKVPAKTKSDVISTCHRSLTSLGTPYVDLLLLHQAFPTKEERIEQYRGLVELQQEGLVRSIGVSNWNIHHIEQLREAGLPLPACNQIEIHPLCTQEPLIAYLRSNNITPVAYSSLAPLNCWRSAPNQASSKTDRTDTRIASIAEKYNKSEAQILLKWAIQHGYAVLPKSIDPAKQRMNFDLFEFSLSDDDMQLMDSYNQNTPLAWPGVNPLDCP